MSEIPKPNWHKWTKEQSDKAYDTGELDLEKRKKESKKNESEEYYDNSLDAWSSKDPEVRAKEALSKRRRTPAPDSTSIEERKLPKREKFEMFPTKTPKQEQDEGKMDRILEKYEPVGEAETVFDGEKSTQGIKRFNKILKESERISEERHRGILDQEKSEAENSETSQ